nr:MAG TPA: hypothetical protein [Caudoviricetes sp.]
MRGRRMCKAARHNYLSHMLSHCFWTSVTGNKHQNAR